MSIKNARSVTGARDRKRGRVIVLSVPLLSRLGGAAAKRKLKIKKNKVLGEAWARPPPCTCCSFPFSYDTGPNLRERTREITTLCYVIRAVSLWVCASPVMGSASIFKSCAILHVTVDAVPYWTLPCILPKNDAIDVPAVITCKRNL